MAKDSSQSPAGRPSDVRPLHRAGGAALILGALGVVFGDIGTSPLYAFQTVFALDGGIVKNNDADVYGVVSLIFWAITLIVSVKYVTLILRADNDGEGGVMALAALARKHVRPGGRRWAVVMILGVLGASLFYGDSVITPAISVMSAIEGLEVPAPSLAHLVLPIGVTIIVALFLVQRFGTELVGRVFGPVMVVWFTVLALLGLRQIVRDPAILRALSPSYAVLFIVDHPGIAFVAMGAIVLSITGAEALYADMGHFGRSPIRRAWFFLVFPALTLNYLGQAALIREEPDALSNPFFRLAPGWAQLALVILATLATVIASQAVISGSYSVTNQAIRLGYLPRLTVRHTSHKEGGQIYLPAVNWVLFAGVITLLLIFQHSSKLATAYGLAVTGTFLITTVLFLIHAEAAWHWPRWKLILVGSLFGWLELTFFVANLTKVAHGGWLPLLIAAVVVLTMMTWQRGRTLVTERRQKLEGKLVPFVTELQQQDLTRVPGTAVFLHPDDQTTPLGLRENVTFNKVLHESVVILSAISANVPYVPEDERVTVATIGHPSHHIHHVTVTYGFQDVQDVPKSLAGATSLGLPIDPDTALYFLSRITLSRTELPNMSKWRKRLFTAMAHNAADPTGYYRLPPARTIIMGTNVLV